MKKSLERSKLLFGDDGLTKLKNSHVLIAGVGGVGGFVAESLARAGVGTITLVDHDVVSESNINRQIIALYSRIDELKINVMKERIADINPDCCVICLDQFIRPDDMPALLETDYDYVVDAIDSLNCKVALVDEACQRKLPVVSSMGAGRRINPNKIEVSTLNKTFACALARNMRQRLKKRGIGKEVKVVFSTELPFPPGEFEEIEGSRGRVVNGTASYIPGIFGLMISGVVINDLTGIEEMKS